MGIRGAEQWFCVRGHNVFKSGGEGWVEGSDRGLSV